ncbi:MAG TPA: glycosyltransferase family 4 protein [Gammaproteobacteria bacterium]|nr:glycosyltransferase family 4 protein [Gammaproteobacteria bacterium]
MTVLLCRPTLSLRSGTGPLMRLQAEALRAAGERVELHCRRGALKFFLETRLLVRRASPARLRQRAALPGCLLVDHGMRLPEADMVFVHNLFSEAVLHLPRDDWRAAAGEEAAFFDELDAQASIVANSELVRRGLVERFGLEAGRIVVERPGFDGARFNRESAGTLRTRGRAALGIDDSTPLVGFVTSGDFGKRGLDVFLQAAEHIADVRPNARFFVVGSTRLPDLAARHPFVSNGRLLYRPKGPRPEPWFAALDVFLYPARFEEFGLVVTEALALGVPVLSSRRVGAVECLPAAYEPWVLEAPEARAFAERALSLLADAELRRGLGEAGAASAASWEAKRYADATTALMLERLRAKAGDSMRAT